jgi:hypothetical protein
MIIPNLSDTNRHQELRKDNEGFRSPDRPNEAARDQAAEFEVADTSVQKDLQSYRAPEHRQHPVLPIERYLDLTVPEILEQLDRLDLDMVREVQRYEGTHRRRKTLMVKLERLTRALAAEQRAAGESR